MFMDEELKELKDRISQMSDDELLQIVEVEYDDYRREALDFAKAELEKRNIPYEEPGSAEAESEDSVSPVSSAAVSRAAVSGATVSGAAGITSAACDACGGVMR